MGLQKGNAEPIYFLLDINVWNAGDCYQVKGVTFGCDTIDGNSWNKSDKGSRNCKWYIVPDII